MKRNSWSHLSRTCFFFLCMAMGGRIFATEPLYDQYSVDEENGWIFPSECCWMTLPASERLTAMKRAEIGCSAIGGPVGKFKLESGKLWLTGLHKCGGDVALSEVYPDFESPTLANWLTGTFTAQIGLLCNDMHEQPIYSLKQVMDVEQGIVKSVSETRNNISSCSKNASLGAQRGASGRPDRLWALASNVTAREGK